MFATVLIQTLILSLPMPAALTLRPREVELESARAARLAVTSIPTVPVNGSPVLFRVRTREILKSLSGDFLGRHVFFDFDASTGAWYGFAGIGLDTASGPHPLALEAIRLEGDRFSLGHSVTIGRARYRSIALSVPGKYTEPDPETVERITQERELKSEVFNRLSPQRWWSGPFAAPIDSLMTDAFGTRRTFNGKVQSGHYGQDFRADEGSPVAAMNHGMVILAREMFYEGGFVVLDHGQGLLTLYMHLSKILVKEGEIVAKRQTIALSGGSGRATAPHLHVGIRWQGVYVNPAILMKLPLP